MKSNRFNDSNFNLRSGFGRLIRDAFDDFEERGGLTATAPPGVQPRVDLFADEQHFFVTAELPGVSKGDVNVALDDNSLTIGASVSRETPDGRKNITLKRSIALPDPVAADDIRAKLEDGILTVTLPKAKAPGARSIPIE